MIGISGYYDQIHTMGLTKTEMFTAKQNQLAQMLKVLGHPARIAILQEILATKGCVCGGLVETLGLAQPTVSQHLKELKNAGIIKGSVDGTTICYCINEKTWSKYKEDLSKFFSSPFSIKKEYC
jgi:DNA-binding transcriptional ArsR family regulator